MTICDIAQFHLIRQVDERPQTMASECSDPELCANEAKNERGSDELASDLARRTQLRRPGNLGLEIVDEGFKDKKKHVEVQASDVRVRRLHS